MAKTHVSGRALAAELGVSEKAVRKAALAGRIPRADAGLYDVDACRAAWAAGTDPSRSKVRTTPPKGSQSAPADVVRSPHRRVRTAGSAPLPPADDDALWAALDYLVALVPWAIATHGGSLQLAFDVHADLALDLPAELNRRGFALPGSLEPVDWPGLAEESGLAPITPAALAADYARRRAEG